VTCPPPPPPIPENDSPTYLPTVALTPFLLPSFLPSFLPRPILKAARQHAMPSGRRSVGRSVGCFTFSNLSLLSACCPAAEAELALSIPTAVAFWPNVVTGGGPGISLSCFRYRSPPNSAPAGYLPHCWLQREREGERERVCVCPPLLLLSCSNCPLSFFLFDDGGGLLQLLRPL
jgi:hypothetical protein